ncbi:MAG: ACT domain-containing protein [Bacteroidaceae bacterium]|nr:ACT domain-containing protein [Bacteroidaceae bacterium]
MTLTQISVFVENKPGRVGEVIKVLADNGINVLAFSQSDGKDFGIFRLIVNEVAKAVKVLKEASLAVMTTEVFAIECPNTTGSLAKILSDFSENGISIDYMYAFQYEDMSKAIIRAKDSVRCTEVLKKCGWD